MKHKWRFKGDPFIYVLRPGPNVGEIQRRYVDNTLEQGGKAELAWIADGRIMSRVEIRGDDLVAEAAFIHRIVG